jgi:tartrate-resistant acid phosphatase type 5
MTHRFLALGLSALLLSGPLACSYLQGPANAASNDTVAAAPAADVAAGESVMFAVIGDFGSDGPDEAKVSRLVHEWNPDFIITTGDNNYPSGAEATIDDNIAKHYHRFIHFDPNYTGRFKDQGAATNRFFPSLGNHDWGTPGVAPYLNMFDLPGNERYYSFRRGPVEFFAIDSDVREPDGAHALSKQADWLKGALAGSTAQWKLVYMHHPPFSSGKHGSALWTQWPYREWGATAVLAGHDHHYERIMFKGFPYFVVGLGGAKISKLRGKPRIPGSDVDITFDKAHGAIRVRADDLSITFTFYTHEGKPIDSLTLPARP